MATDPSISLQAQAPAPNPLGMISQYAGVQNALNQNQAFQLQYQAKQGIGQIMATSASPDEAYGKIINSPLAPYAGDFLNSLRNVELTNTEIAGKKTDQNATALQHGLALVGGAIPSGDPTQIQQNYNAALGAMDPSIRARVQPSMDAVLNGVIHDLPTAPALGEDPAAFHTRLSGVMTQRLVGALAGAGITGDQYTALVGGRQTIAGPQGAQVGTFGPLSQGAPFNPSTFVPNTIAPHYETGPFGPNGAQKAVPVGGGNPGVQQEGDAASLGLPPGVAARPSAQAAAALGTAEGAPNTFGVRPPPSNDSGNPLLGGIVQPPNAASAGPAAQPYPARQGETTPTLTGQSPGAISAQQHYGAAAGDYAQKIFSNAGGSPLILSQIDGILDSMKAFRTGGASEIQANIGKIAQGLQAAGMPISNDQINAVSGGSLPASQFFDKQVKQYVIGLLQQVQAGMGQSKKDETTAFLNLISRETDPAAVVGILNKARYAMGVGNDQANEYVDFTNKLANNDPSVAAYQKLGPVAFPAYYNKNYDQGRVMQAGLGGKAIPQTSPSDVQGGAASVAPGANLKATSTAPFGNGTSSLSPEKRAFLAKIMGTQ